jgi:multicomponent Na+:H+ antiporter subunit A
MNFYLIGMMGVALGAVIWPFIAKRNAVWAGWLASVVPTAMFVWLIAQTGHVMRGEIPVYTLEWVPQMQVVFELKLNGLGLLLSLLISGIGALILIYGGGYLKGSAQAAPFFGFVQVFMLAMLGLVISDNLIVMFVFWELTSVSSYLLIGLNHSNEGARKSALRALLVTGAGGLALMAGIILLAMVGGSYSISELRGQADVVHASPFYVAIVILIVLGAFTKSAQFPFHFWLPDAMAAPTPVSAYLHSATMVKAGVFLLALLTPILGGTTIWHDTLTLFGAATMLLGGIFALAQTDLKRLLAYSTMSALGTLVMLLGLGTDLAIKAAMVFLIVHALYKAPLFMIAGVVDKATGTRNITLLHGLGKRMPLLAIAAAGAAFSMSGIPPFIGFIGKELLYEAKIDAYNYSLLVTVMGFAANAINVAVALKVGVSPFRGPGEMETFNPAARKFSLLLGPLVLVLAGTIIGIFPSLLGQGIINPAVSDIAGGPVDTQLKLWHGFNLLLLLSFATVVAGVLLYAFRNRVRFFAGSALERLPLNASAGFDWMLARTIGVAGKLTRLVQHGSLRLYLVAVMVCLCALIAAALAGSWSGEFPKSTSLRLVPAGIAVLTVLGALAAVRARGTVMAVLAMGSVGFGIALLFALFGAPDLALTQILVETLTLALFAFVIRRLPPMRSLSTQRRRVADAVIATIAGLAVTAALLAVRVDPSDEGMRVSAQMAAKSLPEAHGRNIVNVILVDFRAFDTLGEVCVLAIAAIGVAGLLTGEGRGRVQSESAVATPLFRTAVKWLTPLLLLMAVWLLLRGHNEPGGGFIGGLVAATALILRRLASARASLNPQRKPLLLIAAGIFTAFVSTLPSVLAGQVFMKGIWGGSLWLPLVGKTKFGTPFLFDVGVFLAVVGACLLILSLLIRDDRTEPAGTQTT